MKKKEFITIKELAQILGISRIAVFKKVKKGEIKAIRIGRTYAIPTKNLPILNTSVSSEKKKQIDSAVAKTVREYGETLKLLGKE